jgi:hypothetical protein
MKCYLRLALAVVVSSLPAGLWPARAAEEKADPVGIWVLKVTPPGRPTTETTLNLEKAGARYVGYLTDPRGRTTPLKDVQVKGAEFSFKIVFDRQGREFALVYKGQVTGDAAKGQVVFDLLGQKRSIPFTGARKKQEATLAGIWKIAMVLEGGNEVRPTLRLKQEEQKWVGDYIGTSGKETHLPSVQVKDGELSFQVTDLVEGEKVDFDYTGKMAGDTITGTAKLTTGKDSAKVKFRAQKVQVPTANVAGTWKLRVPLKTGEVFEPTLKLVQEGSSFSGTYMGEQGETPVMEALILGDEIAFEVARERDGKKYRLRYQGKVKGDSLAGSVDYSFDGMTGLLEFEGKRVLETDAKKR